MVSSPQNRGTTKPKTNEELYQRLISCTAREALMHIKVYPLFRHYIEVLPPWYDVYDEDQYCGRVVLIHALEEPTMFKAVIAFSAWRSVGRLDLIPRGTSSFHFKPMP